MVDAYAAYLNAPVPACTDTRDVAGTVEQVKRCVDAGAEIVRITVQGKKEAEACKAIREALFKDRCCGRVPVYIAHCSASKQSEKEHLELSLTATNTS